MIERIWPHQLPVTIGEVRMKKSTELYILALLAGVAFQIWIGSIAAGMFVFWTLSFVNKLCEK